jgi:hypothetical protein
MALFLVGRGNTPWLGRMKAKILSDVLFIGKTDFLFPLMIMKVDHGVENEAG